MNVNPSGTTGRRPCRGSLRRRRLATRSWAERLSPSILICITLLGSTLAACSDDTVVEIGVIERSPDPAPRIQVPDSAKSGESVLVRLVTYGDGCVSFEDTITNIADDSAEITPLDRRQVGGGGALRFLTRFPMMPSLNSRLRGRRGLRSQAVTNITRAEKLSMT